MDDPPVVTRDEWLVARKELLVRERELTRQRDTLNAGRRNLPMVEIDKNYELAGAGLARSGPFPRPAVALNYHLPVSA